MDLTKIMERLSSFPEQGICVYNGDGQLERKTYPTVKADINNAINELRAWGVEPSMRVGILSTNWYEYIIFDMALLELRCTTLSFPEEFGNKTSRQLIEDYDLNLLLLAKQDTWPTTTAARWTAYIDAENPADTRVRQVATKNNDEEYTPAIAFSSGSSGKIKGMTINPHGVEDTISKFYHLFDISNERDSLLVFLPLSSYQQRLFIYAALYYGIDLCLVKPAQLFAGLKDYKPTLCLAPPLLYEGIHAQFTRTVNGMPPIKRNLVNLLRAAARG